MKKGTTNYLRFNGGEWWIRDFEYKCQFCHSKMEMSICKSVQICHECETIVPTTAMKAYWAGFDNAMEAAVNILAEFPEFKLYDERYKKFETYRKSALQDDIYFPDLWTFDYLVSNWIKKQHKNRKESKRKPLKIWYPS